MFKKPGPEKLQRLASRPTDADLKGFAQAARKDRNAVFNYFWRTGGDTGQNIQEFLISVKQAGSAKDSFEWRMYKGTGPDKRELWFYVTGDLFQIYQMIVDSSSDDLEQTFSSTKESRKTVIKEELSTTFDGSVKIPIDELQRLRRPEESALSGELALVHITNILQSISMADMTGRLRVKTGNKQADIFFDRGAPYHATGTMGEGNECMLRCIGLDEGQFHFEPKLKTDEKTIADGLESLILQGVQLVDNTRYLTKLGVVNDSILCRKNPDLSERDFEELLSKGEPINMSMLKAFYLLIDSRLTLKDLLLKTGLTRSKWVPVVANLIRCNAVSVIEPAQTVIPKVNVPPKHIDPRIFDAFMVGATRKHTNLLTHAAILFMLKHEFLRCSAERPLTFILFEFIPLRPSVGSYSHIVPSAALKEIMERIDLMKRPIDLLGHYEENEFALILPEMKGASAVAVAEKIITTFAANPHVQNFDTRSVQLLFGIATVPEEVDNMLCLLSAAELAKEHARSSGTPICLARSIPR